MKKISILLLLVLVCSCSKSDDSGNSGSTSINPPAWIHGIWIQENSTVGNGYIFTNKDFLLKGSGWGNTSFASSVELTNASGGNASVHETITSNSYNIDIDLGVQIHIYHFNKISTTKIEWMNGPTSSDHYYFIKQ